MSDSDGTAFVETLRAKVGSRGTPSPARDPVNQPMIRHWCDAMSDHNPVYTDPDFAEKSIHGGIVAPPTMLNAWTMPGKIPRRPASGEPVSELLARLDAAGFTSVVATNSEHDYERYLQLGDHLAGASLLEDVSEQKRTALGVGHFVTTATEYRTQGGEIVGRMRFRILKFAPRPAGAAAPPVVERGAPPVAGASESPSGRAETLRFEAVSVGDELPECPIPITTTLIVAGAIASRDYQDVHHDRDLAVKRGSPDIFMNILTTKGLCGRFVGDWAGPEARMRRVAIRLGAPNYPYDTMTLSGSVRAIEAREGRGVVEVAIRGRNRLGDHCTGTIELELPVAGRLR